MTGFLGVVTTPVLGLSKSCLASQIVREENAARPSGEALRADETASKLAAAGSCEPDALAPRSANDVPASTQRDDFATGLLRHLSREISALRPLEDPEVELLAAAELGYRDDETVCLITAGGSAVGTHLLRRAAAAYPAAWERIPGLRMIVVAGPRIDPASLAVPAGVEVHGFVPRLARHLTACDVAVLQGGLTTTMELAAARRPFLYVPLGHHFEQQIHVPHRLEQYKAGRGADYATMGPEALAQALVTALTHPVDDGPPVETDGRPEPERCSGSCSETGSCPGPAGSGIESLRGTIFVG
jgi:predicted glycosyltransferase